MRVRTRWILPALIVIAAAATAAASSSAGSSARSAGATATPIKHVVVIFQENVSFDHYFGTYPSAANTDGQPFAAAPGTPSVNGFTPPNPNLSNPVRLDTSPNGPASSGNGELTCDQDHGYTDEQKAFDDGAMDLFVQSVGTGTGHTGPAGIPCNASTVMDYYDGNATTARTSGTS